MTTQPAAHTLRLPRLSAHLLSQVLTYPGHITKPDDLYRAGAVVEDHLAEIPPAPAREAGDDARKAWSDAEHPPIALTERQRATCQAAVKAAVERGFLGASKYSRALLRGLGLEPEGG